MEKYKSMEEYNKKYLVFYSFAVNRKTEKEIMKTLDACKNKSGYIKYLIKMDAKRRAKFLNT